MRFSWIAAALIVTMGAMGGCKRAATVEGKSLPEARRGFVTKLTRQNSAHVAVDPPPPGIFDLVYYDAPLGKNAAYLTSDRNDGKKRPAIIWITGGDCNTIGDVWSPRPANNDQSASAFRKAGIIMMFPSLRGGNENPGVVEGFLGEVDDVIAAATFLAKQPQVDRTHIYLGGHSTGGTMALLVAECTDRFRCIFSFGPVADVSGYGPRYGPPVDLTNEKEISLRSPEHWLAGVKSPTFVIEGTTKSNIQSLERMASLSRNPEISFVRVAGETHFTTLAPMNALLAKKILADDGTTCNVTISNADVAAAFGR